MGEAPTGARAMCVWLGTLASWRPTFIKHLVRRYRTTAEVLQRSPAEIAAFAVRGPARENPGPKAGDRPRERAEAASDAGLFEEVLREGPAACLHRAEDRAPGDLVVAWTDALYPDQLRDLGDPPLCLFVRGGGDAETARGRLSAIVDTPLVAVVGTRGPSPTARTWRAPSPAISRAPASWSSAAWPWASTRSRRRQPWTRPHR